MVHWELVRRIHVVRTIAEYNRIGRKRFLATHGFEPIRGHVLVHEGGNYDSKAIAGVAHGYATGTPLQDADFADREDGAAKVLRDLGFVVRSREPDSTDTYTEAETPDSEPAREAWTTAARAALIETAHSYGAVVNAKDLAALVERMSRVRSTQPPHRWIGHILARVASDCAARDEPLLSSLCVLASGSVGAGYADTVLAVQGMSPADPDQHAADERHRCYQHFGATLPADGGTPMLTTQLSTRRARVISTARAAVRPATLCPIHHVEMPATGVCEDCE